MKALVLAAGEGVRLRPFTYTRPKAMIPVAGKPLIYHLLRELKEAGVAEAVVVVRYKKEMIIDYLKNNSPGIKVSFVEQGPENGTGAAILAGEGHFDGTFLVVAGDLVTEASIFKSVISAHKEMTLAVKKVKTPKEYGVVGLSKGKVSFFQEKAENPKSDLANLSIYCFEPSVFKKIRSIKESERGEVEIVDILLGADAVQAEGFWLDIGYPWNILDANEFMLAKLPPKTGEVENSSISGKLIMAEGSKIINSTIEGNVYIGKNTTIGPNAIIRGNVSIGDNCNIGGASTVKNSVLFDHVNAKHLTYIGDSVVGSDVNFGSGTQIANYRFDSSEINVLTERGWRGTGRNKVGAFIGDRTKFGVLSCTMPGKSIGPDCWISSGVIVNKNIPPDMKVFVKQELSMFKELPSEKEK